MDFQIESYSRDIYEYGNSACIGTESQPRVINLFIQTDEHKESVFREYSLIPPAMYYQETAGIGVFYGMRTLLETLDRPCGFPCNAIIENLFRGIVSSIPVVGRIVINVADHLIESTHYSETIKNDTQVKGKKDIIGVAINGEILKVILMNKIDVIADDIANLDSEKRLYLLVQKIQRTLKTFGNDLLKRNTTLLPVRDILLDAFKSLEKTHTNKEDLAEIEDRVQRIENSKYALDQEDLKKMGRIAKEIIDIRQRVIETRSYCKKNAVILQSL
jgi:hypothetical protein